MSASPFLAEPKVVTFKVWGMISVENVSPSTALTVSDTPSRATEPFEAMKRDSAAGARLVERRRLAALKSEAVPAGEQHLKACFNA